MSADPGAAAPRAGAGGGAKDAKTRTGAGSGGADDAKTRTGTGSGGAEDAKTRTGAGAAGPGPVRPEAAKPAARVGTALRKAGPEEAEGGKEGAPEASRGPAGGAHRGMGVHRIMLFGVVVVALFFGGFGLWAVYAPLESAAIAQGVLSVSGKRKTVQHLEGGLVAEILVEEGDRVAAGQPLILLDDTRARSTLSRLEGQYRSASALESRLEAERDGLSEVRYPEWLRAAADRADGEDGFTTATQDRIFEARARSLRNRTAIYRQRIAQLREETNGLREEIGAQDREIAFLEEEIDGIAGLIEKGFEGKSRLLALKRRRAEVEGRRAQNRGRIARVEQAIGETRLTIDELGNVRLTEVAAELREVETHRSDLRERIAAARNVFARTRITAPVAGTVVNLRVFTRGGVIQEGEPLMDIVPADEELVIEAQVEPTDIDSVYPSLPAQVRLTAFSHMTTPILTGTVLQVSADRLTDSRTGAAWYEARIALDPGQPELAALKLQPGMPAEVMIVTGERTALDYLLKPIVASFGRALREQ